MLLYVRQQSDTYLKELRRISGVTSKYAADVKDFFSIWQKHADGIFLERLIQNVSLSSELAENKEEIAEGSEYGRPCVCDNVSNSVNNHTNDSSQWFSVTSQDIN